MSRIFIINVHVARSEIRICACVNIHPQKCQSRDKWCFKKSDNYKYLHNACYDVWLGIGIVLFVARFAKKILYMHSFKTHFLLSFVSYISAPTAHVFNNAEDWTVCILHRPYSQASLTLTSAWVALIGPFFPWQADSCLWITTWLADESVHEFSCFVWHVEVIMAPMQVVWLFLVKM